MIETYAIKDTAGMSPEELTARTDVATKLIAAGLPLHEALTIAQLGETVIPLEVPQDVRLRLVKEVKASVTETIERVLNEMKEAITHDEPTPVPEQQLPRDPEVADAEPAMDPEKVLPAIEAKPAGKEDGTTRVVLKDEKRILKPSTQRKGGRR